VTHITHVISHDVPDVPEDYVHRIGRTARAKAEGDAFVLVSPAEEKNLAQIERHIGQRLPRVTLPDFDYKQAPASKPKPHAKQGGGGHRPAKKPQRSRSRRDDGGGAHSSRR
jgi:ATP-dependent RNA helicase RhlE